MNNRNGIMSFENGLVFVGFRGNSTDFYLLFLLLFVLSLSVSKSTQATENSPIVTAVTSNDLDGVKKNIAIILQNQCTECFTYTPLFHATRLGHTEIVKELLSHKQFLNDQYLGNALGQAAFKGHSEILGILLKFGANPNYIASPKTQSGSSALLLSSKYPKIMLQLIDAGADVNSQDTSRRKSTILAIAVRRLTYLANHNGKNGQVPVANMYLEAINALLKQGANPNILNFQGASPLSIVIGSNKKSPYLIQAADLLISYGASLEASHSGKFDSEFDYSMLLWAIMNNKPDIVKVIISTGEDINKPNAFGLTPIFLAGNSRVRMSNEMIKLLADNGANPNVMELSYGFTPLLMAIFHENNTAVQQLLNIGADVNLAGNGGRTSQELLASGDDIRMYLTDGTTPLMYAIQRGHYESANLFIDHGATLDNVDSTGKTALHYLYRNKSNSKSNNLKEFLIAKGASIDIRDNTGKTVRSIHQEQIAKREEVARANAAKKQKEEANSFNWAKAAALTTGFVAGQGLKLDSEAQINTISGIIQDSQSGVDGMANTMGALNGAKQKQGYQPDTNITKLEDTPNNDVKSKPKRYYAYYTCTWRVQRDGPDFMDYHRAISNLIEGDSNEELINNKRKAKEIVLSIASSSNNTTLQCDAINSSVEVWGAKTKKIENSLIKRHRTIYINRINKYKNATKRMQKANVNTGSSSRVFGHNFTMN